MTFTTNNKKNHEIVKWLEKQLQIIEESEKINGYSFIEDSQGDSIRIETASPEGLMTLQLIVQMLEMENLFIDFQPSKITRDKAIFDVIIEHQWLIVGWAELHEKGFLAFDKEDVPRPTFFSLQNNDKWELFCDALGYTDTESSSAFLIAQNLRVLDKLCFYNIPFNSSVDYRPISQDVVLFDPLSDEAIAFFAKNSLNPLSKEEFDKFFYERDFSVFRDWSVLGVDMETLGLGNIDVPLEVEIFEGEDALSEISTEFLDQGNIDVPLEIEIFEGEDARSEISTEFNFNCSYDGEQLKSSKKNNLGGLELIDETPFDWFPHCRVEFFRSMSEFNSTNCWLENFFDSTNGFNYLFKTLFYVYRHRLFFLVYWKLRFWWKQFKTRFE